MNPYEFSLDRKCNSFSGNYVLQGYISSETQLQDERNNDLLSFRTSNSCKNNPEVVAILGNTDIW